MAENEDEVEVGAGPLSLGDVLGLSAPKSHLSLSSFLHWREGCDGGPPPVLGLNGQ